MGLDALAIREFLPHRYPFLLVDRVLEVEDLRIVALKNVTTNEPFFQGHFPQMPVMPGVLIIEALAQTAGILIAKKTPDAWRKFMLLASIENARFRKPVYPGDQIRLEAEITRFRSTAAKVMAKAVVDGAVVAEAELMCALAYRPGLGPDSAAPEPGS
jgi:beta-hydroxyacyl-ACP dehydratase FabZ